MKNSILLALPLLLTACADLADSNVVPLQVVSVSLPASLLPSSDLTVKVNYVARCDVSDARLLLLDRHASTLNLVATGTRKVGQGVCPAIYHEETLTYTDSGRAGRSNPFEVIVNGKSWGKVMVMPGREVELPVDRVTFPSVLGASQPLKVEVQVTAGGCINFNRFEAVRTASTLRLKAIGFDASSPDMACTADIRKETHTYTDAATPDRSNPFEIIVNGKSWGHVEIK